MNHNFANALSVGVVDQAGEASILEPQCIYLACASATEIFSFCYTMLSSNSKSANTVNGDINLFSSSPQNLDLLLLGALQS